ncbi:hypothetical protein JYT44_03045 [Caldithrix abyssi]|nr:hypothetical protein [Caldithrix abyssi]
MVTEPWMKVDIGEFVIGIIEIFTQRSKTEGKEKFNLNSYLWRYRKRAQKMKCPTDDQRWDFWVWWMYYHFEGENRKPRDIEQAKDFLEKDAYLIGHWPSCGSCADYMFRVRDFFKYTGVLEQGKDSDVTMKRELTQITNDTSNQITYRSDLMEKLEQEKGDKSWYQFYIEKDPIQILLKKS